MDQWIDSEVVEGGLGIQRISLDTPLRVIDDEKATGKPEKCGGNLPKPEHWGYYDCKSCMANPGAIEGDGSVARLLTL